MKKTMNNNFILDLIISLTQASKSPKAQDNIKDGKHQINSCRYLLNQVLRQYQIPEDHYYVTEKANDLWNRLETGENIKTKFYKEAIVCHNKQPILAATYKGNETKSCGYKKLINGQTFKYREVFHNEHIVPIELIIRELLEIDPTYENVEKVLDKIYICRMLKSENAELGSKFKRNSLDKDEIIKNLYEPKGIFIYKQS